MFHHLQQGSCQMTKVQTCNHCLHKTWFETPPWKDILHNFKVPDVPNAIYTAPSLSSDAANQEHGQIAIGYLPSAHIEASFITHSTWDIFHKIDIKENLEIHVGRYDMAICPGSCVQVTWCRLTELVVYRAHHGALILCHWLNSTQLWWPLGQLVAVSRGYDTCFRERLVMGYADY